MSATYSVFGAPFDELGMKLHKLNALAHMHQAAQLLDHVQVPDDHQRAEVRAASELFEMVCELIGDALAEYQAASRSV